MAAPEDAVQTEAIKAEIEELLIDLRLIGLCKEAEETVDQRSPIFGLGPTTRPWPLAHWAVCVVGQCTRVCARAHSPSGHRGCECGTGSGRAASITQAVALP